MSSPTPDFHAFKHVCAATAKEGRDITTVDLPGFFLQTDQGESLLLKLVGAVALLQEEISEQNLGDLIKKAFLKFKVPETPINIARLENGLNIAELFHGPTLAFKVSCDWLTQETSDCLIGPGPGAGCGGAAV